MSRTDQLVEERIRLYESHLEHIDELGRRVREQGSEHPEASKITTDLEQLDRGRQQLLRHIEGLKRVAREEWQESEIEQVGPMIIWEAAAKRLEKLLE